MSPPPFPQTSPLPLQRAPTPRLRDLPNRSRNSSGNSTHEMSAGASLRTTAASTTLVDWQRSAPCPLKCPLDGHVASVLLRISLLVGLARRSLTCGWSTEVDRPARAPGVRSPRSGLDVQWSGRAALHGRSPDGKTRSLSLKHSRLSIHLASSTARSAMTVMLGPVLLRPHASRACGPVFQESKDGEERAELHWSRNRRLSDGQRSGRGLRWRSER